jgi:hypothetical protein
MLHVSGRAATCDVITDPVVFLHPYSWAESVTYIEVHEMQKYMRNPQPFITLAKLHRFTHLSNTAFLKTDCLSPSTRAESPLRGGRIQKAVPRKPDGESARATWPQLRRSSSLG